MLLAASGQVALGLLVTLLAIVLAGFLSLGLSRVFHIDGDTAFAVSLWVAVLALVACLWLSLRKKS